MAEERTGQRMFDTIRAWMESTFSKQAKADIRYVGQVAVVRASLSDGSPSDTLWTFCDNGDVWMIFPAAGAATLLVSEGIPSAEKRGTAEILGPEGVNGVAMKFTYTHEFWFHDDPAHPESEFVVFSPRDRDSAYAEIGYKGRVVQDLKLALVSVRQQN